MRVLVGAIFVLPLVSLGLSAYVLYTQRESENAIQYAKNCDGGGEDCIKALVN